MTDYIPEMVTLREASRRTGLSYDYLRKGCLRGNLVHIKAGRKILLNFDRLCAFLDGGEVNGK